jgi:hypothetical protein
MPALSFYNILALIGLVIFLIGQGFYPIFHSPEKISASFWKKYQLNRRRRNVGFSYGMGNDRRKFTSISPLYVESEEVGSLFFQHKIGYCITFVLTLSILIEVLQRGLPK